MICLSHSKKYSDLIRLNQFGNNRLLSLPDIFYSMDQNFRETSFWGTVIVDNRDFIVPYILFTALFFALLGIYGNSQLFLFVNRHYSDFGDFFFRYMTNLGDGIIAALLIVILLWVSFRDALTFLIITLLITIIVNILKDHIFPELNRPVAYFGASEILHLIPGYDPPTLSTFPSGHTATAFSVGLYLSILIKNRYLKLLLFVMAFLVGYSRMYISAHFPADVVSGALIGVVITLCCYYLSRFFKSSWMDQKIRYIPGFLIRQQIV